MHFVLLGAAQNQISKGNPHWGNKAGYFDHLVDTVFIKFGYHHFDAPAISDSSIKK